MVGLALAGAETVCPIMTCEAADATDKCARKDGNNIYLRKCKSDWYCNDAMDVMYSSSSSDGECSRKYGFTYKGENEWCYKDSDCQSDNCQSPNTCKFKTLGQSCSTSETNCGAGLKCLSSGSSKVCKKILNNGEACTAETAS